LSFDYTDAEATIFNLKSGKLYIYVQFVHCFCMIMV